MDDEQEPTAETDDESTDEATASPPERSPDVDDEDVFLLPGPTPSSDEGVVGWGLTWIIFSLLLMGFFLGMSFVCWLLARWVGWA